MTQEFDLGSTAEDPAVLPATSYTPPAVSIRISFDPPEIVVDLAEAPDDPAVITQIVEALAQIKSPAGLQTEMHIKADNKKER